MAAKCAGFLESLQNAFGCSDLYELFGVDKDSTTSEIKKAYRRLSLKVHPDRAKPEDVEDYTNKFQVLCKAYLILSDDNKRAVYDDTGCVDDEDEVIQDDRDWNEYWRLLFPKVTTEDIVNFEKKYKKSNEEKEDLKATYLKHEGDMDKIMEEMMLATINDEARFTGLIAQWIADGSVPSYPAFTGETEKKKRKRKRKLEKEEKECDDLKNELGIGSSSSSLTSLIQANQAKRGKELGSFFDELEKKYAKKPKATAKRKGKKK